jgi:hypothetical protein
MPDKKPKNINNKLANEFESRERHRAQSQGNVFEGLGKVEQPKMRMMRTHTRKTITQPYIRPLSEPNNNRVRSHEEISALDKKYRPKGDVNASKNVFTNIKKSADSKGNKGYRKGPTITGNPSDLEKDKLKTKFKQNKVNKILGY